MGDESQKKTIKQIVEDRGLKYIPIAAQNDKESPDFEIRGKQDRFTVEFKTKGDDPDDLAQRSMILSSGVMYESSEPAGPRNRFGGIIHKGIKQLLAHDSEGDTYRIIWVHCAGRYPEFQHIRLQASLYGTEHLVSLDVGHLLNCYYYHDSIFYKNKESLDGVIITFGDQLQICINTLGSRADEFRKSELVLAFDGGIFDPDSIQGLENGSLIADSDTDRKNTENINDYIRKKYGLNHLQVMPLKKHSAEIQVDVQRESKQ